MLPRLSRSLLILLFLLFAVPRAVEAQEPSVRGFQLRSEVLNDPLGIGAFLTLPHGERVEVRLGYSVFRGVERRSGVPCWSGLGEPCAVEALRDEGQLQQLSAAVPLAVLAQPRLRLKLVPGTHLDWARHRLQGLESGQGSSHAQTMWGMELGVEAQLRPSAEGPLRFQAGVHRGTIRAFHPPRYADGAHWKAIPLARLEFGVSYRVRSPR